MIPIKEAIDSKVWLHCETKDYNNSYQFRLRVQSFRRILLSEIDNPENLTFDRSAQLWLMGIEVINLNKKTINSYSIIPPLILKDQDNFEFKYVNDRHLWKYSDFGKRTGLIRFYAEELSPKIKTIGAIAFQLPDDDDAVYSISIENGSIREA